MAKNTELHDRLLALTGPELEALELDIVELELLSGGNRLTLRYALERRAEPGTPAEARRVSIDQIARASRAVSRAIEVRKLIVAFIRSMKLPGSGVKNLGPRRMQKTMTEENWERFERITGSKPPPAIAQYLQQQQEAREEAERQYAQRRNG